MSISGTRRQSVIVFHQINSFPRSFPSTFIRFLCDVTCMNIQEDEIGTRYCAEARRRIVHCGLLYVRFDTRQLSITFSVASLSTHGRDPRATLFQASHRWRRCTLDSKYPTLRHYASFCGVPSRSRVDVGFRIKAVGDVATKNQFGHLVELGRSRKVVTISDTCLRTFYPTRLLPVRRVNCPKSVSVSQTAPTLGPVEQWKARQKEVLLWAGARGGS